MGYHIRSSDRKLLHESAAYIKAHIHERMRIKDLARSVHMNPLKFSRGFRELFGLSPSDFIYEERMQLAYSLLCTTDHSIKTIAALTGYRNVKSFHRAFKNRHGFTPNQIVRS